MFRPMKPETIARRAAERKIEQAANRASLERRIREAAREAREARKPGMVEFWEDMLADHLARIEGNE